MKKQKIKLSFLTLLLLTGVGMLGTSLFGAKQTYALSSIRITELMYDPSGNGSKEFVELYNGGDKAVSLSGWSMVGVDFVFPGGSSLSAKSYLVIVRNLAAFQPANPGARIAGQYGGKLRGSGELVQALNASGSVMSQVSYTFGGAWPSSPRNGGPSLSLVRTNANESLAGCWAASSSNGGTPSYGNNPVHGGNGCSNEAYPVTASQPSTQTGGSHPSAATTQAQKAQQAKKEAEKKKAAEKKKQQAKKEAEQKAKEEAELQVAVEKQTSRNRNKLWTAIGLAVLVVLSGIGAVLLRAKIRKDDLKRLSKKKTKK